MINSISNSPIAFTGRTFRRTKEVEEFSEKVFAAGKKHLEPKQNDKFMQAYRAYAKISESANAVKLEKKLVGYGTKDSVAVKPYIGNRDRYIGLSTEDGNGLGGGYIKADINTPLSTANIHTCAAVNLVDESTNQHFLYHVYKGDRGPADETSASDIEKFLRAKFPKFNKINIIPGDWHQTNKTVNNILTALENINKKAERHFYHFSTENPEIVAHKGKLSYIKRTNNSMTFKEVTDNFV